MANMNQCSDYAQKGPGVKMKSSMGSKGYKAGSGMKSPVKGGLLFSLFQELFCSFFYVFTNLYNIDTKVNIDNLIFVFFK